MHRKGRGKRLSLPIIQAFIHKFNNLSTASRGFALEKLNVENGFFIPKVFHRFATACFTQKWQNCLTNFPPLLKAGLESFPQLLTKGLSPIYPQAVD